LEQTKKRFNELIKQFHSDLNGGDDSETKLIILEYKEKLKRLDGSKNDKFTYFYNETIENILIDKIKSLFSLKMKNVKIGLVGFFIWVEGLETKNFKDDLKNMGLRYSVKNKAWYFTKNYKPIYNKNIKLQDIKNIYGYQEIKENHTTKENNNNNLITN